MPEMVRLCATVIFGGTAVATAAAAQYFTSSRRDNPLLCSLVSPLGKSIRVALRCRRC
jgi:hypothetical protein